MQVTPFTLVPMLKGFTFQSTKSESKILQSGTKNNDISKLKKATNDLNKAIKDVKDEE